VGRDAGAPVDRVRGPRSEKRQRPGSPGLAVLVWRDPPSPSPQILGWRQPRGGSPAGRKEMADVGSPSVPLDACPTQPKARISVHGRKSVVSRCAGFHMRFLEARATGLRTSPLRGSSVYSRVPMTGGRWLPLCPSRRARSSPNGPCILGILLALSARPPNIGFFYKHRGACEAPSSTSDAVAAAGAVLKWLPSHGHRRRWLGPARRPVSLARCRS